jgi:hypothetical protein
MAVIIQEWPNSARPDFAVRWRRLLDPGLPRQAHTFNALGLAGVVGGVLSGIWSLVLSAPLTALLGFGAAGLALLVLRFANRTGNFAKAALVTVIGVFLVGFPLMFFTGGGSHSGKPLFFVLALLFTVFMVVGYHRRVCLTLELLGYTVCCLFAYFVPAAVTPLEPESAELADVLFSVVVGGGLLLALSLSLFARSQPQPVDLPIEQAEEDLPIPVAADPSPQGDLVCDRLSLHAFYANRDLRLTPKEFALLNLFLENPNRLVSYAELAETIWKAEAVPVPAMQRAVSKLRLRLIDAGFTRKGLKSVRGQGYVFE